MHWRYCMEQKILHCVKDDKIKIKENIFLLQLIEYPKNFLFYRPC
jgi:hypothetical protein